MHAVVRRGAGTPTRAVTERQSQPRPCPHTPISQLLGNDKVPQVVLRSPFIVLKQCVGVPQTVASLRFHCLVPELPRQLQCLPVQNGRVSQCLSGVATSLLPQEG